MQSARWERDRQVNSDSSNTVNRGRASERERKCMYESERETGREKELKRVRSKYTFILFWSHMN